MNRTHHIGGYRIAGGSLGNSKVCDLHLTFLGNYDVLGFDISVNDVIIMSSFNTHAHLNGNADCLLDGQSCLFFDIFLKGNSLYQFHNNIVDSVFFPYVIYIDNIGVHQPCCRLRLNSEFGYKIGIFRKFLL